jgi:hypothetical protein
METSKEVSSAMFNTKGKLNLARTLIISLNSGLLVSKSSHTTKRLTVDIKVLSQRLPSVGKYTTTLNNNIHQDINRRIKCNLEHTTRDQVQELRQCAKEVDRIVQMILSLDIYLHSIRLREPIPSCTKPMHSHLVSTQSPLKL